jgi:molybdopterin synthase catalytic subunit
MRFRFADSPIDTSAARLELLDPSAGGYASFEGWVRDHNEGLAVSRLEYEAFEALAIKEGERVLAEALERFPIKRAACVHRIGDLAIGELAVWVGVSSAHRGEAFDACRYVIDEIKHRLPIWKKEHYANGDSGWVNCERCGAAPRHGHSQDHDLAQDHGRTQDHEHGTGHGHAHEHGHDPVT